MYKLNKDSVTRNSDSAQIPFDSGNNDYILYLKWLKEGGIPTPFDQAKADKDAANSTIDSKLAENDLKIIRALSEKDQVRIQAHLDKQAALRATKIPPEL